MVTDTETLKRWIEEAQTLSESAEAFPQEVQNMVCRLASVVQQLAYENIILKEAL